MWPEAEKTTELLQNIKDGDPDAINRLLERHREALRRMVDMRLDARIRQRVDASDVVQEAMMEANRRMPTYIENPAMPFHLWIRQIATDRLIDQHRRHVVSQKRSVDVERAPVVAANLDHSTIQFAPQLQDRELTPAAAAIRAEMQRRFESAIEEMDEHDQEILVMRHFEKLSNQEVAQALGLSEPASSMRYLRAVRRLKKLLNVNEEDE